MAEHSAAPASGAASASGASSASGGSGASGAEGRRVAVVTGGSRGIGRAVVEALLGAGYRVFFGSRRQDSLARTLADLAARFGPAVAARPLDVRVQAEVDAFFAWVTGQADRIDCLVNNAGLGIFGPVDGLSGDQWREVIDTNLSGPFYCLRAAAPVMKRQGSGWILNIGSLAGRNPMAGGAAYNASKFGLIGLSEAAMLDLRQSGVRVAAILPGSVDTTFGDRPGARPGPDAAPSPPGGGPAGGAGGATGTSGSAGDRAWMLAPEDVAAMVLHLLSYPERALPSLVEMRPTRPPRR